MITTTPPSLRQVTDWLRLFIAPDQVTELRCLPADGATSRVIISGFYDGTESSLSSMANEALQQSGKFGGIYFTPNPLRPEVLKRRPHWSGPIPFDEKTKKTKKGFVTSDVDVLHRKFLLIDIDPSRAEGCDKLSTTDAEKSHAWEVAEKLRSLIRSAGDIHDPLVVDSGNGWHLYYRLREPADDGDAEQVTGCIADICDTRAAPHARIDRLVFNLSRIMKIPGTLACKGESTTDRPHRHAAVVEIPESW